MKGARPSSYQPRGQATGTSHGDTIRGLSWGEHRMGLSLGDFAPRGIGQYLEPFVVIAFWAWWCPRPRVGTGEGWALNS